MPTWIILTGEYPPQPGGVSDYTRLVAESLAQAGDEVHVWAPPTAGPESPAAGVQVHRLPDHFGPRGLAELKRALDHVPAEARCLVQYVPHAFGHKALNLFFCIWLWRQRRRHAITIMFHEVAYPWVSHGRWFRHNFLAAVNRVMVFFLVHSARHLCVSIPAWKDMLRPYSGNRPVEWLPIPSTMPQNIDRARVEVLRKKLCPHPANRLLGHFGTFGGSIAQALRGIIPTILQENGDVVFLLIGRGGTEFAAELQKHSPQLSGRLIATGEMEPSAVSEHLIACDLLIQPYIDGISTRRTSAMAGLACGRPIVTTRGPLMETIWEESGAVCLADSFDRMPGEVAALLLDQPRCERLGSAAAALYRERFELHRTTTALRAL